MHIIIGSIIQSLRHLPEANRLYALRWYKASLFIFPFFYFLWIPSLPPFREMYIFHSMRDLYLSRFLVKSMLEFLFRFYLTILIFYLLLHIRLFNFFGYIYIRWLLSINTHPFCSSILRRLATTRGNMWIGSLRDSKYEGVIIFLQTNISFENLNIPF